MKTIKAVVKETAKGTDYSVYVKRFGMWWYSWGYQPLTSATFLIDDDIERLKLVYGDKLLLEDCGTRAGKPIKSF